MGEPAIIRKIQEPSPIDRMYTRQFSETSSSKNSQNYGGKLFDQRLVYISIKTLAR